MHFSSLTAVGFFGALSVLLVACGGSDHASGPGQFSGAGGSGQQPSTSTGASKAGSLGEVLTISGTTDGTGPVDGPGRFGLLSVPMDMVTDGTHLYIAEGSPSNRIRTQDLATGAIVLLAGNGAKGFVDGVGTSAKFSNPSGIAIDPIHQNLYVADKENHAIRKVAIATAEVTTIAGYGPNAPARRTGVPTALEAQRAFIGLRPSLSTRKVSTSTLPTRRIT